MIGVFDSGYGGLTVYSKLKEALPNYDFLYLGDNLRAPYGNRPVDVIIRFLEQAVDYMFSQGCVLIIIACNTATGYAIKELQEKYLRKPNIKDKKILGIIIPQVEAAVAATKNKRISIVGTKATINSNTFKTVFKSIDDEVKLIQKATPLLVPLIEENWHNKPEARMILKKYLREIKAFNSDTLILGCTHFPFLYKEFRQYMGKKVNVMHPGKVITESLLDYLSRHPEINTLISKKITIEIYNYRFTRAFFKLC